MCQLTGRLKLKELILHSSMEIASYTWSYFALPITNVQPYERWVITSAIPSTPREEVKQKKNQQWNWDRVLILMAVVGLRLWGWVITLSPPSSNRIGRRSMSLGCQLLLKALLTPTCSFCLFISCLCLDFHTTDMFGNIYDENAALFFILERKSSLFFPLAKYTIPSGESYVYLTASTMLRHG